MVLARLAILFVLAASPFVPFLAALYPGYVVPIVLAGALVVSVPPGIVLSRALHRNQDDEFATNYQESERSFFLAAAASQVGVLMASLGRGVVGALGVVASAGGMMAAIWLLLRAAPTGSRRTERFLASADQDRLD
jgi:hypothetical protein